MNWERSAVTAPIPAPLHECERHGTRRGYTPLNSCWLIRFAALKGLRNYQSTVYIFFHIRMALSKVQEKELDSGQKHAGMTGILRRDKRYINNCRNPKAFFCPCDDDRQSFHQKYSFAFFPSSFILIGPRCPITHQPWELFQRYFAASQHFQAGKCLFYSRKFEKANS